MHTATPDLSHGAKVAEAIVNKLGGAAFAMVSGSNYFTEIEGGVSFRIGRNSKSLVGCKVIRQDDEHYTMKFISIQKKQLVERFVKADMTVPDMLQHFTTVTGLQVGL